ncbi:SDR family NAD(P)-dependent oxidoreductase [Leifsonia sp. fls2-241-R2A-40a]|uniref:SDR family NAD(P)-dependent oxidoreductase n=1 Tax=Leifsonia sp. fls2-241-R2A-40a TaxID=3040290 RepID=UPI0025514B18|nr:SDR family NAD(P)-dependent oxidoreductase [Leifsonia sp. fls2-241-R2A-40a]
MSASPVVVITGASSGLGRGTALAFARRHARLVLVARGAASLEEVAVDCAAAGARDVAIVAGDTTDESTGDRAVDTAIARHGRLDVWVNVAAVGSYARFWEQPAEEFRRILDVDIHGYTNGSRSALRVMVPQRSGLIVNVASILGEVPQPYSAAYSMSKAAVIAFGRSVRSELSLAKSPVHMVTVLPPTLDTPFFQHAGNRTGRALKALPPVYPPTEALDAIVAAWKNPGTPERTVSGPGKALVRQHRRRPQVVEAAIARQTELGQFSKGPAAPTTGNLNEPSGAPLGVTGGWGGRSKQTGRLLVLAALAGAAASAVRAARGKRD